MAKKDDPGQKVVDTAASEITNVRVKDEQQPKLPWMISSAMFLASLCWYGPIGSTRSVLIPQLFAQLDPAQKVWAVRILATVASITGAITNLLFGAFSDVTRSRFGKRKPYIVVGTIVIAISLFVIANVKLIVAIIFIWIIAAAAENAIAQQGFALLAAQFLGNMNYTLIKISGFWEHLVVFRTRSNLQH